MDRGFYQYQEEFEQKAIEVLRSGWYILGNEVKEFEKEFASYTGAKHCVGLANGLDALWIAFRILGIGPGDEVLVQGNTYIASVMGITMNGATPIFIVPDEYFNIDTKKLEEKITDKTKMIVPVHIGGYPVDMDPIMELAKKHNILVLEDAAHAFGAMYKGRKIGTIGDFAAFSMHEVKNITSFGEGGIASTNIPGFGDEMKRARFLRLDFSCPIKDWLYNITPIKGKEHPFVPGNASTTEIQGLGL